MKPRTSKFICLAAMSAAGAAAVPSIQAATLLTGDTTTVTNEPLPLDHGSNRVGTPNIALVWDAAGGGTGNGILRWESYDNWNSRLEVYQMNEADAGAFYTIALIPEAGYNALFQSTDFDIWNTGGEYVINWEVSGATSGSLGSGQITFSEVGLNPLNFGGLQGVGSETVTMKLTMDATSTGLGSYLAMDNLSFDQVPEPASALLGLAGLGAFALRRSRR